MDPKPILTISELGSSDEEGGTGVNNHGSQPSIHPSGSVPVAVPVSTPIQRNPSLDSRRFWKAGAYDVGVTRPGSSLGQLEHARVHPKFLHSNATSHKWAFGAIAELLDNAVDEICTGATFVKLDKLYNKKDNSPALLFQDDGGGMDPECIRQCMSLGYSKKKANTTIGQYGNGFKTSTMRLGADVIVFSRTTRGSCSTQSIGLLSYTFLRKTGQDDVIVPMVDFELSESNVQPIIHSSLDDWSDNLKSILEWSPFASNEELMLQFEDIGTHGTKIIIYNLWLNDDGILELDFDHDEEDIRLRDETNPGKVSKKHDRLVESHVSYQIRYSLRAYASVLYLKQFTNFNIILRGKPVQQYNIADELKFSKVIMYRPQLGKYSKEVSVETRIGFVKEAPLLGVSGFNVYHKNRLIRPFWKVTPDGTSRGSGVVGVLEANFVEPAHDKQDFERSASFLRLEMRLRQMIIDFWKTNCHLIGLQPQIPELRNMQKESLANQSVIGLSVNMQREMHLDRPVVGLAANLQESFGNAQTVVGPTSNMQKDLPNIQPIIGLAIDGRMHTNANNTWNPMAEGGDHDTFMDGSADCPGSAAVDQICEENIQLFLRCEGHRQKEMDLRRTVEELERELEETKRKCSQLASHLENQRKQKTVMQQTDKA